MGFWNSFWNKLFGGKTEGKSSSESLENPKVANSALGDASKEHAVLGFSMPRFVELMVALLPIEHDVTLQKKILTQHGLDEFRWKEIKEGFLAYLSDTKNPEETKKNVAIFASLYAKASSDLLGKPSTRSVDAFWENPLIK